MRNSKGIKRASEALFAPGHPAHNHAPVGTVSIREFSRTKDRRAFVKVAEPNVWRLRAHVAWEAANGAIPDGMCVHHRDGDKLNDAVDNLALLSVAGHLAEHRAEYQDRCVAALVSARRARRWSTKSETKRTGRPPTWTEDAMTRALADVRSGVGVREAGRRHGIPYGTIYRRLA